MSQDLISDGLNGIMNAKRSKKEKVVVKASRFFLSLLEIAQREGYLSYKKMGHEVEITFQLHVCKAIKPRYSATVEEIEKYIRRYLPSRHFGILVLSTSRGLLTHREALEQGFGGSLIAYFY